MISSLLNAIFYIMVAAQFLSDPVTGIIIFLVVGGLYFAYIWLSNLR